MFKAELKQMWRHKILLLTVLAISIVPLLYSVSFLKGVWDPYGHLNNLGMAVVNEDKPVDYNGNQLAVGNDIVDSLKKDDTFDWQFVGADEAKDGLKSNKYYMVITLPSDMSQKAATVTDVDPEQLDIKYETNGSLNYPIETASKTAVTTIKDQVSSKVTLAYAKALVGTIKSSGEQIQTAADGAQQLTDGAQELDDGVARLQSSLPALSSGVQQLATGGNQLSAGVTTLVSSTRQSAFALNSSLPQLKTLMNGSGQVASGVGDLVDSTKTSAATVKSSLPGLTTLNTGADRLAAGANQLVNGANQISAGVTQLKQGADQINTTELKQQIAGLLQQIAQNPQILQTQQGQAIVSQLNSKIDQLDALKNGIDELDGKVNNSQTGLKASATALNSGAQQVAAGTAQTLNTMTAMSSKLNSSEVTEQLDALSSGAKQVAQGNSQTYLTLARMSGALNSDSTNGQLNQLTSGANRLASGLNTLNSQVPSLTSGASQLKSGTSQLASGSQTLQSGLQDGADKIKNTPLSDKTAAQIASPVKATQTKYTTVKNYGHGLAPFFLSVALFVGCVLFNYGYPVRKKADKKGSWFGWYASKAILGAILATAMAIILGGAMMGAGLQVDHPGQYFGSMILYTNALMALSMFLAIAFDNPGRYITMLVLILSLGAAGGTFPIATSSHFYQTANKITPIAREVTVLRNAISSGIADSSVVASYHYFVILLIVAEVAMMVTMYLLMKHKGKDADRSREDGNQTLLSADYSNWD